MAPHLMQPILTSLQILLSGNQKYVPTAAPSEDGSFTGNFDVLPNDNYSGTLDVSIIARSIESDKKFC